MDYEQLVAEVTNSPGFKKLTATLGEVATAVGETRKLAETKLSVGEADERFNRMAAELTKVNTAQNEMIAEIRKAAEAKAETAELYGELRTAIKNSSESTDALRTRLEMIEHSDRPVSQRTVARNQEHFDAMVHFMIEGRKGKAAEFMERAEIKELEQRALAEGVLPSGGFLVEPSVEQEIVRNVTKQNPIMTVARITPINGTDRLIIRKRTGTPTAYWVGESGEPAKSNAKYGKNEIVAHMLGVETPCSIALLQDVGFIENELTADAIEAMNYALNYAFLLGDGVAKPHGILVNTEIDTVAGSDSTNHLVTGDDFYSLLSGNGSDGTGLMAPYRLNAVYAFNSVILAKILKLKATATGEYIWQANLTQGPMQMVAGKPYINCEDMANDGTAALKPVMIGDFYQGYRIAERMAMFMIADPYTAKPDVEYTWYSRWGGAVAKAEAIKILTCS